MSQNRSRIVVTEIPYMVNKARLVEKIAELVHEKRLEGISDIRDEIRPQRHAHRHRAEAGRQRQRGAQLPLQAHPDAGDLRRDHAGPGGRRAQGALPAGRCSTTTSTTRRTSSPAAPSTTWTRPRPGPTSWRACSSRWINIDEVVAHHPQQPAPTPSAKDAADGALRPVAKSRPRPFWICAWRRLTGLERDKIEAEYARAGKARSPIYKSLLADETHAAWASSRRKCWRFATNTPTSAAPRSPHLDGEIDIEDLIQEEDMVVTMTHFGYVKRLPQEHLPRAAPGRQGRQRHDHPGGGFCGAAVSSPTPTTPSCSSPTGAGCITLKCYQIPEAGRTAARHGHCKPAAGLPATRRSRP